MKEFRVNAYSIPENSFYPALLTETESGWTLNRIETEEPCSLYISPGWIDMHAHIYCDPDHDTIGIDCDSMTGIERGVHLVVDAGTSGADTIDDFVENGIRKSRTEIKAFLHISGRGITNSHRQEGAEAEKLDIDAAVAAARKYPNEVIGIKVRIAEHIVGDLGMECLIRAKKAADILGLPMMVHIGEAPPDVAGVLIHMGKGDVLSHAFHGRNGYPWDAEGYPTVELREAIERGVNLDLAHGFTAFSYDVFKRATSHPLPPFTISSDLHSRSCDFVRSLPRVMTKTLACGLPLNEVIRSVTVNSANVLKLEGRFDNWDQNLTQATLFQLKENVDQVGVTDSTGQTIIPEKLILPCAVIKDGVLEELKNIEENF